MPASFSLVPQDVICIINNEPRTTSLKVAEVFGKLHKHVLAKIESLDCSDDFASANFSAQARMVKIDNGATRETKYYEMTKDGFMFLVMGFTGKKAAQIKEAYINAFNWMAQQLFGKPTAPQTTTADERSPLRAAVSMLVGKRSLMYPEAYALVHQRFGVEHIDQLTPEQTTQAIEYVHRLVLEGEILPAASDAQVEPGSYQLTAGEVHHLHGVFCMVDMMRDTLRELEPPLRLLNAPIAPKVFDGWNEISLFLSGLKKLRSHCDEYYRTVERRVLGY
ncbi:Rha family transcriptional regulator [Laribacter hongkongensis]|uniref:Rha family transcriptional regulator n=1 Tax=Laribacter hongkongensis TaxID=168471 RepID=UPI001EFD1717|nr:Rha family transcriptional regulator [Laribacter hongkongensis]MCG9097848.1 Rha family transcriptional regulator [Laribacter hongkongensis]